MWIAIITTIINLFSRHKVYNDYKHICYSSDINHNVVPRYTYGGSLGKKSFRLRYNVYESGTCDRCYKRYRYKVATNISKARLYTKFNIKIQN